LHCTFAVEPSPCPTAMALSKKTPAGGRPAKAAKGIKKKVKTQVDSPRRPSSRTRGGSKKTATKGKRVSSAASGSSSRAKPGTVAHQSTFARRNWAKRLVFVGKKSKTSTGLFKRDLMRNSRGSIVSKRKSAIGRQRYHENNLDLWTRSFMQTRSEQGIKGFVLCKKAGNHTERSLFSSTRAKWQDLVASRMMNTMQRRPEIMGRISKMLTGAQSDSEGATTSSKVKTENQGLFRDITPGDQVRVQKGAANFEYRGQTGVVERFQLGRVVVNFQGTLKAVKLEDLTKV